MINTLDHSILGHGPRFIIRPTVTTMHPKEIVARRGPPSVDYEGNQIHIGMLGSLPSPLYFDFYPGLKLQCKNKLADFL